MDPYLLNQKNQTNKNNPNKSKSTRKKPNPQNSSKRFSVYNPKKTARKVPQNSNNATRKEIKNDKPPDDNGRLGKNMASNHRNGKRVAFRLSDAPIVNVSNAPTVNDSNAPPVNVSISATTSVNKKKINMEKLKDLLNNYDYNKSKKDQLTEIKNQTGADWLTILHYLKQPDGVKKNLIQQDISEFIKKKMDEINKIQVIKKLPPLFESIENIINVNWELANNNSDYKLLYYDIIKYIEEILIYIKYGNGFDEDSEYKHKCNLYITTISKINILNSVNPPLKPELDVDDFMNHFINIILYELINLLKEMKNNNSIKYIKNVIYSLIYQGIQLKYNITKEQLNTNNIDINNDKLNQEILDINQKINNKEEKEDVLKDNLFFNIIHIDMCTEWKPLNDPKPHIQIVNHFIRYICKYTSLAYNLKGPKFEKYIPQPKNILQPEPINRKKKSKIININVIQNIEFLIKNEINGLDIILNNKINEWLTHIERKMNVFLNEILISRDMSINYNNKSKPVLIIDDFQKFIVTYMNSVKEKINKYIIRNNTTVIILVNQIIFNKIESIKEWFKNIKSISQQNKNINLTDATNRYIKLKIFLEQYYTSIIRNIIVTYIEQIHTILIKMNIIIKTEQVKYYSQETNKLIMSIIDYLFKYLSDWIKILNNNTDLKEEDRNAYIQSLKNDKGYLKLIRTRVQPQT